MRGTYSMQSIQVRNTSISGRCVCLHSHI